MSNANRYDELIARLARETHTWLVTGVAGFIGSNLLESLLKLNQRVVGLDNFSTGHSRNLEEVRGRVSSVQWENFHFIHGDIRNLEDCHRAMQFPVAGTQDGDSDLRADGGKGVPVEYVLHQAALGSVPRSLADPATTNDVNIAGFLNVLIAARDAKVRSFTYAASSSTYGDHPALPKVEHVTGKPLSPYAVTKLVNELYADVFARCYDFRTIGLRYFNVFGRRQDPNGAYAAVIPRWIAAMIKGEDVRINGDGETSRDFCFIENVIQANLLSATTEDIDAVNEVYNVAVGGRTTLNELFDLLKVSLHRLGVSYPKDAIHQEFRAGDVRHSQADIGKAAKRLGYSPRYDIRAGIEMAMPWYLERSNQ